MAQARRLLLQRLIKLRARRTRACSSSARALAVVEWMRDGRAAAERRGDGGEQRTSTSTEEVRDTSDERDGDVGNQAVREREREQASCGACRIAKELASLQCSEYSERYKAVSWFRVLGAINHERMHERKFSLLTFQRSAENEHRETEKAER